MNADRAGRVVIAVASLLGWTTAVLADSSTPNPEQQKLDRLTLENQILAQRYAAYGGTLPEAGISIAEGQLTPGAQREALAAVRFAARHIANQANLGVNRVGQTGTCRELVMTSADLPDLLLLQTLEERYQRLLEQGATLRGDGKAEVQASFAEPIAVAGATAELLRYFATETSIGIAKLSGQEQWLTLELAQQLGQCGNRPAVVASLAAAQLLGGKVTGTALWQKHAELSARIAQSPCGGSSGTQASGCTAGWKDWHSAATELAQAVLVQPDGGQSLLARAIAMQMLIGGDPGTVRVFVVALDDVLGETVTTRHALMGPKMYFSGSAVARYAVLTGGERRLSGVVSTHCGYSRWTRTNWKSKPPAGSTPSTCTESPPVIYEKEPCQPCPAASLPACASCCCRCPD